MKKLLLAFQLFSVSVFCAPVDFVNVAVHTNGALIAPTNFFAANAAAMQAVVGTNSAPTQTLNYITPEQFGAVGNGDFITNGVDSTAALQAAINFAAATGGKVFLGTNRYITSAPLVITNYMVLEGAARIDLLGSISNVGFAPMFAPTCYPFIAGSVIQRTNPGPIICITNAGFSVNLRHLGLTWSSNLCFINSGTGIEATPSKLTNHCDLGVIDSSWEDITVFGNDTNHYAYHVVNGMCDNFTTLRSFGGGGFNAVSDQYLSGGNPGNMLFSECWFMNLWWGTNHAFATTINPTCAAIDLLTFNQCQFQSSPDSYLLNLFGLGSVLEFPARTQYCLYLCDGTIFVSGLGNTLECAGGSAQLLRLPTLKVGINLGNMCQAGGLFYQTNAGALFVGNQGWEFPNLETAPLSWSSDFSPSDDTFTNAKDFLRPVDNATFSATYNKVALAMTQHYLENYQTYLGTNYGWQWSVADSIPSTFTNLMALNENGNLAVQGNVSASSFNGVTVLPRYKLSLASNVSVTNTTLVTVLSNTLPPGTYAITGTVQIYGDATGNSILKVWFTNSTVSAGSGTVMAYPDSAGASTVYFYPIGNTGPIGGPAHAYTQYGQYQVNEIAVLTSTNQLQVQFAQDTGTANGCTWQAASSVIIVQQIQ